MTERSERLVQEVEERLRDWGNKAKFWYVTYYFLGIFATVLVVTAATEPPFAAEHTPVILWAAALVQGLNTFLISLQKAASYRSAWRCLKLALVEYVTVSEDKSDDLRKAMKAGWDTINRGYD